jgi:hypothetical protein
METKTEVKTWQVNYTATYWVRASSEDEAIDLAIEEHEKFPDGSWEGFIDHYDSENYNDLGEK